MDREISKHTNKQKHKQEFLKDFRLKIHTNWSLNGQSQALKKQLLQKCATFMGSWPVFSCAEQVWRTMAESHFWRFPRAPLWCLQSQTNLMTFVTSPWSHKGRARSHTHTHIPSARTHAHTHVYTQRHTIPHRRTYLFEMKYRRLTVTAWAFSCQPLLTSQPLP